MGDWDAGWYPDPELDGQIRYWHGTGWTDFRHPTPENYPVGLPGPDASGEGTRQDVPGPADQESADTHQGGADEQHDAESESHAPEPRVQQPSPRPEAQPSRRADAQVEPVGPPGRKKSKIPLLGALGVAGLVGLVVALQVVWLTVEDDQTTPRASSARATSEPSVTSAGSEPGADPEEARHEPARWDTTYAGQGDAVLQAPTGASPRSPGLVEFHHEGEGDVVLRGLEDDDFEGVSTFEERLISGSGTVGGTAAYNLTPAMFEDPVTAVEVEADGQWRVTFTRIDRVDSFGTSQSGNGYAVFAWDHEEPVELQLSYTAKSPNGYFTLLSADGASVFAGGRESFEGTITFPDGKDYLVIQSDADWELTTK